MAKNTLLNVLNSIILEICGGGVKFDQNSKNFFSEFNCCGLLLLRLLKVKLVPIIRHVRKVKIQISLRIPKVWSES